MTLTLTPPEQPPELKPRIIVFGVGGAGGNAVNNMIRSNLEGVECVVANTDAQALSQCLAERKVQLGLGLTQGLGAGSRPEVGRAAAEEGMEEILAQIQGGHMVFVTAGMGGGTGTGAAPVIATAAKEQGLLTVGVVTKPFHFEGTHRMALADQGIERLADVVDTLIVIPNQNLFKVADEKTTFTDAFQMADEVLYAGVRGVTELMISPGLINLDFADIRSIMDDGGKAMMGSGEADGESRALASAEAAIANPLLEESSLAGANGCLINITGGPDLTLYEVDEAANRIRDEVDPSANIIFGSVLDESLEGRMRVSIFATGVDSGGARSDLPAVGTATRTPTPPPAVETVEEPAAAAASNASDMSILNSSMSGDDPFDDGRNDDDPGGSLTVGTADPVRISPASSRQPEGGGTPDAEPEADEEPEPVAAADDYFDADAGADADDDEGDAVAQPFAVASESEEAAAHEDAAVEAFGAAHENAEEAEPVEDPAADDELPPWPETEAGQPDMFSQNRPATAFGDGPTEPASDLPDDTSRSNRSLRRSLLSEDPDPEVIEQAETPEFLREVEPEDLADRGHKRSFLSRLVKRSGNETDDADIDSRPPANDETAAYSPPDDDDLPPAPEFRARAATPEPEDERPVFAPERMADPADTVVFGAVRPAAEPPVPVATPTPRKEPVAAVADPDAERAPPEPAASSAKPAPSDDELLEIPAFLRRQSN